MPSLFEQLSTMTTIVADTGDFQAIEKIQPRDATTNPSLITKAAKMDVFDNVVRTALTAASKAKGGNPAATVRDAVDRLAVEFGLRILNVIDGRVSTEVDARLSYDEHATMDKARKLIKMYEERGATRDRVLIKIASTWEGIQAARKLEREGIHCNLTLLFGLHQAVACAEAEVTLISPFVGRILDWHKKETGRDDFAPEEDPGVLSVTEIYRYYKHWGHPTEIMGASFRNIDEIKQLAGCDLLTIAPKFIEELKSTKGLLTRKLSPLNREEPPTRLKMTKELFDEMHTKDRMANEKLAEGIQGFSEALVELEQLLKARLAG